MNKKNTEVQKLRRISELLPPELLSMAPLEA
jgi:hypothetical protein